MIESRRDVAKPHRAPKVQGKTPRQGCSATTQTRQGCEQEWNRQSSRRGSIDTSEDPQPCSRCYTHRPSNFCDSPRDSQLWGFLAGQAVVVVFM